MVWLGRPASSSPPRSSTGSKCSTIASGATRPSGTSHPSNSSDAANNNPKPPDSHNRSPTSGGHNPWTHNRVPLKGFHLDLCVGVEEPELLALGRVVVRPRAVRLRHGGLVLWRFYWQRYSGSLTANGTARQQSSK